MLTPNLCLKNNRRIKRFAAAPHGENNRCDLARQRDPGNSRCLSTRDVPVVDSSKHTPAERRMQRDISQNLFQRWLAGLREMNTAALLIPHRSSVLDSMLR